MRTGFLIFTVLLGLSLSFSVQAAGDRGEIVRDPLTAKECGACHMAYPPIFLPARSWRAVMAGLDEHFGEDASLPAEQVAQITAYLTAKSADGGGTYWGKLLTKRIGSKNTLLRLTETPYWVKEHRGHLKAAAMAQAKSKANCPACHRYAAEGIWEED